MKWGGPGEAVPGGARRRPPAPVSTGDGPGAWPAAHTISSFTCLFQPSVTMRPLDPCPVPTGTSWLGLHEGAPESVAGASCLGTWCRTSRWSLRWELVQLCPPPAPVPAETGLGCLPLGGGAVAGVLLGWAGLARFLPSRWWGGWAPCPSGFPLHQPLPGTRSVSFSLGLASCRLWRWMQVIRAMAGTKWPLWSPPGSPSSHCRLQGCQQGSLGSRPRPGWGRVRDPSEGSAAQACGRVGSTGARAARCGVEGWACAAVVGVRRDEELLGLHMADAGRHLAPQRQEVSHTRQLCWL